MSLHRWAGTTVLMSAIGWALWCLGPALPELRAAASDPQGLVDRAGADALLLVAVPVLAWLCWAWGALGLLLTVASTAPGAAGRLAGLLLGVVLPASARHAAALALGLSLSTAAPVLLAPATPPLGTVTTAAAADDLGGAAEVGFADWPSAPVGDAAPDRPGPADPATTDEPGNAAPSEAPDWPGTVDQSGADHWPQPAPGQRVVLRGDCLWDIAADWLQRRTPSAPVTDGQVQRAAQAWYLANADVIGRDPDRLLPGQVLRPPVETG